jgi:hypothetical protein
MPHLDYCARNCHSSKCVKNLNGIVMKQVSDEAKNSCDLNYKFLTLFIIPQIEQNNFGTFAQFSLVLGAHLQNDKLLSRRDAGPQSVLLFS